MHGLIGVGRHERTTERGTYCNGYRDRTLDTRLGSLQYFPPSLGPLDVRQGPGGNDPGSLDRRRVHRWVDDLVQAMGLAGINKNTVSKLCKDIDERVNAFP